jgi:predicted NAD/FAD-binding protein
MRIAIVGSGISGLVAAHVLREGNEIVVFEASDRVGGHTNTVHVGLGDESHAVDTGFIVYNERTYPLFTRLLEHLGVATQPSDMSFSVACERTGVEWASPSLNTVFAQRLNLLRPSFHAMLRDIVRFNREVLRLLDSDNEKVELGEYLCGAGYSSEFVDAYIVPMGAAIWSAAPKEFLRFPATTFVRFFENHGLLDRATHVPWRVIHGGSRRYVEALMAPFRDRIRTRCAVRRVQRERDGVSVSLESGETERFDRVILAVHSDQALRILADATPSEQKILGSIAYQRNEAFLHTDTSVMPRVRRAWASWNYRRPRESREGVFVTYHMNRLQNLKSRYDFFVTLNGSDRIDPAKILAHFEYYHPVFDARAVASQKLHGAIDGQGGIHFCGAYWGYGFHEDGVRSALTVCHKFGRGL